VTAVLITALVAALGGGAALSLWLRWRLQRAEDDRELWHTQANRLTTELREYHAAASDELARQREVIRVARSEREEAQRALAAVFRDHPEWASEYLLGGVRIVTEAPGAGPHPPLPGGPAAHDAVGGGRGNR
jgi:hypothetical protein